MRRLAALVLTLAAGCSSQEPAPVRLDTSKPMASRRFHLKIEVTVPDQKPDETVELWVPRPVALEGVQMVEEANPPARSFVHVKTAVPAAIKQDEVVDRREIQTPVSVLASAATELSEKERQDLAPYLEPERENAADEEVQKIARSIAPDEKKITRIARAFYEYVLAHMKYEKPPGKGWGHGSTRWACTEGYGNCTDFHALFMNLCRARGIPARFQMGISIPKEKQGSVEGYHCWCEFYVPGGNWVPVDASEAWKHPDQRDYFFGNLDPNRVTLVLGRDLTLEPAQQSGPVGLLSTGYAEKDGKPVAVKRQITYSEY